MTGEHLQAIGVILGPTAVGKTELAIQLVEKLEKDGLAAEIINADSRQIYQGMDIGTAKPTPHQQLRAKHHLLDVVKPDEVLGLAEYLRLVRETLAEMELRGVMPILVGGSGQYLSAFLEDWRIPAVPPQPSLRAELLQVAKESGVRALHDRLRQCDRAAAQKIHPNNVRRVIRALEVIEKTGEPFSIQQRKGGQRETCFQIGLTLSRESVHDRADRRLQLMLERGFVDEVRSLLTQGYTRELPSFSALGYREMAEHVRGDSTLDEAVRRTKKATHRFIRRQLSWFRNRFTQVHWLDWSNPDPAEVYCRIQEAMETQRMNHR